MIPTQAIPAINGTSLMCHSTQPGDDRINVTVYGTRHIQLTLALNQPQAIALAELLIQRAAQLTKPHP